MLASSTVIMRSAGSSSATAICGLGNCAPSMISAQSISSAMGEASQPKRSRAMSARYLVQLLRVGSWNFWPLVSARKCASSPGCWKAETWWSNHQVSRGSWL